MPEPLLEAWQRRGVDDRPGLRADRGGAERALPAARGRSAQARLRRASRTRTSTCSDRSLSAEGELLVKGPNVFAGYWRNDEATREAFTDDGWLRTGDLAERDDEGYYRISGRLKDMYISGGENVYPAEVESVLCEHEAVVDAAVVGVPDESWGEAGVAFVVPADGVEVTEAELLEHCLRPARAYKVPTRVRLRRRAAALGDEQGAEERAAGAARGGGGRMTEVVPAPTGADGRRSRRAAPLPASGCSRPPSACSPTSATTRPRS